MSEFYNMKSADGLLYERVA